MMLDRKTVDEGDTLFGKLDSEDKALAISLIKAREFFEEESMDGLVDRALRMLV